MFTKERVLQVIEEMKVADYVGDLEDFDLVYSDGAITAWSELVARLGLDVVVDDNYTNGIHVRFSMRLSDKDGNKETFNSIIDSDFGFTVGDNSDEQVLTDIADIINGWQEQYEDIMKRFSV